MIFEILFGAAAVVGAGKMISDANKERKQKEEEEAERKFWERNSDTNY